MVSVLATTALLGGLLAVSVLLNLHQLHQLPAPSAPPERHTTRGAAPVARLELAAARTRIAALERRSDAMQRHLAARHRMQQVCASASAATEAEAEAERATAEATTAERATAERATAERATATAELATAELATAEATTTTPTTTTTTTTLATPSVSALPPFDALLLVDFPQQSAYGDYQEQVDQIARNSSRVSDTVGTVSSNIPVDPTLKRREFALSRTPTLSTLSSRASWLARDRTTVPATHTCVFDNNAHDSLRAHAQNIMSTIPHLPPDKMAAQFLPSILKKQFPASCQTARLLLYSHWTDLGLGSELHWLEVAFTAAYETKRTLVILEQDGWLWAEPELCTERTFSCYFEPISNCQILSEQDFRTIVSPQTKTTIPVISPANLDQDWHSSIRVVAWKSEGGLARTVPHEFRTLWPRSVFWWRSMLMRWIFRPRQFVLDWVQTKRDMIPKDKQTASIHIRSGDKTHGNSLQVAEMGQTSVELAIERLEELFEFCFFEFVFVSTRDPQIIAALKEKSKDWTFQLIFDEQQLRYGNGFHTLDLVTNHLNRTEEALQYIKDVLLMTDCDFFIGVMESNLSRLVAELGASYDRFLGTPLSLTGGGYIVWP